MNAEMLKHCTFYNLILDLKISSVPNFELKYLKASCGTSGIDQTNALVPPKPYIS